MCAKSTNHYRKRHDYCSQDVFGIVHNAKFISLNSKVRSFGPQNLILQEIFNTVKKILALIAILLALGLVAYFYFEKESPTNSATSIYHAIPAKFPLALASDDWPAFFEKIDTFKYAANFNQQDWMIGAKVNLHYVAQLMALFPKQEAAQAKYTSLVAFGNAGNSQLGIHLVQQVSSNISNTSLAGVLKTKEIKFQTHIFQDETIYTLSGFNGLDKASMTIKDGLLLFSLQASFVEESILALENKTDNWDELLTSFTQSDDLKLFIKPKELNYLSSYFLKSSSFELINGLKEISDITALQLNFFSDELSFSGYALAAPGTLLDTLKSNLLVENYLINSLPSNTAFYKLIALSEQDLIASVDLDFKTALSIFDESLILFSLESYNEEIKNRKGALLALESNEFLPVLNSLDSSIEEYTRNGTYTIYKANSLAQILNQVVYTANYFQEELFFAKVNDALVFSETLAVVEQFILAQEETRLLKTNEGYTAFKAPMSNKCKLDIFCDLALLQGYLAAVCTENTWQNTIGKINVQYTPIGAQLFCNGKLAFNKSASTVSKGLWSASLDSLSIMKPQIVRNHSNGSLEVLCQDAAHQLYLMNTSGEQEWKVQLTGKVVGDIQQIDYYKNNKLQYIFNTSFKIYVIDRNGDFVDGFPIDLPTKASNGLLLVNYDNADDYRYMLACDNGNLYGYEQNGSPLPGWSPKKDVGQVSQSIQYAVKDNKDYLYFSNDNGVFFALNRKAEDRFKPVQTGNTHNAFNFDENAFSAGDRGVVYEIDMLGNLKTKTILDSSFVHCEVQASIVQNSQAFAFASGSSFKFQQSQWKNFSSYTTQGDIRKIESLINNNKLWFVLYTNDLAYLIDELGTLHPDFPIQTKSDIRLAHLIQGKDRILLYNDSNGNLVAREISW